MVGVGAHSQLWARGKAHRQARFEAGNPADQDTNVNRLQARSGQARQARIRGHEPAKRFGARGDYFEASLHIFPPVGRACLALPRREGPLRQVRAPAHDGSKAFSHGFDGRQGIIQLVSKDANQPLPGLAFFLAQGAADVRNDQEVHRHALLLG